MTTFLIDIWHDLRAKRLWPVAVALLVATLAVPVVVVKPTEAPPAKDTAPPTTTAALPVVSRDSEIVNSSDPDASYIKNPCDSQADSTAGTAAGTGGTGSDAGTGMPGSGSPAGGGSDVPG